MGEIRVKMDGVLNMGVCLRRIYLIFFAALFMFKLLFADTFFNAAFAGDGNSVVRVAVFPFDVAAHGDMKFIGQGMGKMLCSRIASQGLIDVQCFDLPPGNYNIDLDAPSPEKIALIPELQGVDFFVTGTVTIVGESISSDARLISNLPVLKSSTPSRIEYFAESGTGVGDIMRHASVISGKIKVSLLQDPSPPAPPGDTGVLDIGAVDKGGMETGPIDPGSIRTGPIDPGSIRTGPIDPGSVRTGPIDPGSVRTGSIKPWHIDPAGTGIFQSRSLDMAARGMAVADIDASGVLDIVLMDDRKIRFFIFQQNRLIMKGEYMAPRYIENIALDTFDSNGNGRSEIWVSAVGRNNRVRSYVLEWDGIQFKPLVKDGDFYVRVLPFDGKKMPAGQKRGIDNIFMGSVMAVGLDGKSVVGKEKLFPAPFRIFGTARGKFHGTGSENLLWFDEYGFLLMGRENRETIWKSQASLGSTAVFLEQGRGANELKEKIYISQRLCLEDIDGDGIDEIITFSNSDMARGFLAGYRKFNTGNIEIFQWTPGGLESLARGNPVNGYIADIAVKDMNGDSSMDIVYCVVTSVGTLPPRYHTKIFVEKMTN
ncbi:MAG: hypothetical protein HQK66_00755 [Desulfamplus sp.]|nr:hypothetical protein [Desulfamplus sp.]